MFLISLLRLGQYCGLLCNCDKVCFLLHLSIPLLFFYYLLFTFRLIHVFLFTGFFVFCVSASNLNDMVNAMVDFDVFFGIAFASKQEKRNVTGCCCSDVYIVVPYILLFAVFVVFLFVVVCVVCIGE